MPALCKIAPVKLPETRKITNAERRDHFKNRNVFFYRRKLIWGCMYTHTNLHGEIQKCQIFVLAATWYITWM